MIGSLVKLENSYRTAQLVFSFVTRRNGPANWRGAWVENGQAQIGTRKDGSLFCAPKANRCARATFFEIACLQFSRNSKRPKTGFHCFQRFRESVLQKSDAHALSVDYWMGHENRDRGTRHAKQLIEDVAWGRLWTRKIGLGSEFLANFSDSENRPTKAALVAYSNWD